MRVAIIPTLRDYPWGAPGHCMAELVRSLVRAGHEVLWLLAPIDAGNPAVAKCAAAGVRVVPLPAPKPRYGKFASLRHKAQRWIGRCDVAAIVGEFRPDHVFLNQGGTWCGLDDEFFDVLQNRSGRYSLICHLNQPRPAFSPANLIRARAFMANARRVFFNSGWTLRLAECQIARAIPQSALFQYPVRFDFKSPLKWPSCEVPTLAMVTRIDAYHKGIDLALQAIAMLRDHGIAVRLRIHGNGPDEGYVSALLSHLRLDSIVELCRYTDDLERVWADAEMLLLPSRFEGLAVSMVEAMGFGRVVLRTPYGGAAEWVEDSVTGYICPAADAESLCLTLRQALAERERWREMGLRAYEKVRRERMADPGAVFLEALSPDRTASAG